MDEQICKSILAEDVHAETSCNPTLQLLNPQVSTTVSKILGESGLLYELVAGFGSPLNLVLPEVVAHNIEPFFDTYNHYGLRGRIFFSSKPNRSAAILREVSTRHEVGVDVSSSGSLRAALNSGISANRIEATGPKNVEYVSLCLQHEVLLNVDSIAELTLILNLRRQLRITDKVAVIVRLSGFGSKNSSFTVSDGTFGVTLDELSELFSVLTGHKDSIDLKGFAFHLNTNSNDYKAFAVQQSIQALLRAKQEGFSANILNIGGGFRINYVESGKQWQDFLIKLRSSLSNQDTPITWNRNGLGFRLESKKVVGVIRTIEHHVALPPADQLCALLQSPLPEFNDLSVARILDELGIELHIEPGRALLDQVGISIARVEFVKKSERGEPLVGLSMNRSNLNTNELTLLCDPVLISDNSASDPVSVFLMGNLCVANELLIPRKVTLSAMPILGNLIAFINTAPYSMDFNESVTLHQPVAEKIALRDSDKGIKWFRDTTYLPRVLEVV